MKIGPPLPLPLLRRRGHIIWYSEQGLHGRICIFVAISILFSLVFDVLESKAKKPQKSKPLLLRSSCLLSSLCLHQVLSKVVVVFFESCWIFCAAKKERERKKSKKQKKSKKREEEVLRKCAIIFSWVRNFISCSGKCCSSNVVQGSTNFSCSFGLHQLDLSTSPPF